MKIIRTTTPLPEKVQVEVEVLSKSGKIADRAQLWSSLEERIKSTVSKEQLETLYKVDGLTFREVNDYVDFIVGPGFYFEGNEDLVKKCEEWTGRVRIKRIMEECIKDIFIGGAGNSWVELGYNEEGNDIPALRILNPKTMDYIRDYMTKDVEIDEENNPVGYKKSKSGYNRYEMEWTKDKITKDGKVLWSSAIQDGRDRIAHVKLFGIGESYLGMSPVESIYMQAIIRLNLENNVGEGAFRSGGLVAYIGREGQVQPSPEVIDKVVTDLQNVTTNTIFGFRNDVKLDRMPSPDLTGREELIMYFAAIQSLGMGFPLSKHMNISGRLAARVNTSADIDFEQRIASLQERFGSEMREKLFFRYLKARGLVNSLSEVPKLIFRTKSPNILRETINMLTRLGRRDIIRRDPELEKKIREELGLPTTYVQRELDQWTKDETKTPEGKDKEDILLEEKVEELVEENKSA